MTAALALRPTPIDAARPQRVALVTTGEQVQAEQRLAILQPALEFKASRRTHGNLRLKDGTPVTSFSRMVAYTSETSGVSEGTLYRWMRDFNAGGLPALADRQRRDKHTSRFFKAYPKASWLAAYLYLEEKASCRVAHEAIVRDLALLEIPAEDAPSYETVRAWLRSMPPSLTVYARRGRKAYRERMAPYLRRDHTETYANQVWVGDHMIHDVEAMNDCFDDAEWGAPVRIRFTAFLDYRSRMFVGASWCWEGSSRSIAAAMRRGIQRFGPPEHVYADNGKDYRSIGRGAQPGYLAESPLVSADWWQVELAAISGSGLLARLGVCVTHCLPHHPQSKSVERAFGTVHERFDKVWPTYTSGAPFTRPEKTEAAMMQHRRLLAAGRAHQSKHPRASDFIMACAAWLEEYAETPHSGQGMDGATPRQIFESCQSPAQKPAPEPAALALLMAERETRLVRECAVTLRKRRYVPCDQAGWGAMHERNEREVMVVYDSADLDNVAVLDGDGVFLAWLEAENLTRFAPADKRVQARIADSMATRRRLEKGNREVIELVSRTARSNGAVSPMEAMAGRLQLAAGETGADLLTQRRPRLAPETTEPANPTPGAATRDLIARLKRRDSGI